MGNRRGVIFDIECDSLLEDVTKIYCLSYKFVDEEEVKTVFDQKRVAQFFQQDFIFIGHNIILYDLRVIKKLLGIEVSYKSCIDTLFLSQHLFENRLKHGLESYGSEIDGLEKVKVSDEQWAEGDLELMGQRCSRDVAINSKVYLGQMELLNELYEGDKESIDKLINYISFKADCIREQEEVGLRLDIPRIEKGIEKLTNQATEREKSLILAMPKIPIIAKKTKPKVLYKADGTVSKIGQSWFELLEEKDIPGDYEGTVEIIKGYQDPNPNSGKQKKDWLFSLGWSPEHFRYVDDDPFNKTKKKRVQRKVPQIGDRNDNTKLCPSVLRLVEKEPAIEHLAGLTTINHRIGVLKGFLRDRKGDRIYASASAVTSTMRLKHKVVVNLPGETAPWAEDIRSSIIADEGCVLVGSDLSGAEDRTKRNFIYPYDSEYVMEMEIPGYDPHIDLGIRAGLLTQEEADFYTSFEYIEVPTIKELKEFKRIKDIRHKAKTTNFSSTYKVGKVTLARTLGITEGEAELILNSYWERNKSIEEYEANCKVKEIDGRMWILNEVSNFWLPLRSDRDRLSATNQSAAVYVFDIWLGYIRSYGIKVAYQAHDEIVTCCKPEEYENIKSLINKAMDRTNELLKLNVQMGCSIQSAFRYSDCH